MHPYGAHRLTYLHTLSPRASERERERARENERQRESNKHMNMRHNFLVGLVVGGESIPSLLGLAPVEHAGRYCGLC